MVKYRANSIEQAAGDVVVKDVKKATSKVVVEAIRVIEEGHQEDRRAEHTMGYI